MHTGNAFIRLICILCMVEGCYSLTCGEGQIITHTFSPIVQGLTCKTDLNGEYKYLDKFSGAERYRHSNGMLLFKPGTANTYVFAAPHASSCFASMTCPFGYITLARTGSFGSNAGEIPNLISEKCAVWNSANSVFTERPNAFLPNPVSECTCDKGWTWLGSICVECNQGKYKDSIGRGVCSDCPVSSDSITGSVDLSACTCNAGYTEGDAGTCGACGAGTYKPDSGNAACLNCPESSNSFIGSIAHDACMCNAGYTGGNGGTGECTPCSIGTYKANPGPGECTPCSTGTYKANAGPGVCTPCPWGEYTDTTGASSSTLCTKCEFQHHPRSDGGGCERCAISFEASVLTSASSGIGKIPGCIEFVN